MYPTVLDLSRKVSLILVLAFLSACGEPMFENAGSQHSLLEDRKACAMKSNQSPTALAYRQNPTAHPDYVSQVFAEVNRCIERKGWKQVRSLKEQEQTPRPDPNDTDAFVREFEERLASVGKSGALIGKVEGYEEN